MNTLKEYLQQGIKEEQRLLEAVSKEKFVQEKLPYKRTALDPIMSKATMDYHYGKLHKAYVDKANDDNKAVFQVAGAFLHNLFFPQLQEPTSINKPTGEVLELIESKYDSFNNFKSRFTGEAMSIQGSGWIYIDTKGDIKTIQNHKMVDNTHKEKFRRDMLNDLNKYDGGVMIAHGGISKMRSFEKKREHGKYLCYLSNYRVNQEDFLMSIVEQLHDDIHGINEDKMDMVELERTMVREYVAIKKQRDICDGQKKYFDERFKEIAACYYRRFNKEIQEVILKKSVADKSEELYIFWRKFLFQKNILLFQENMYFLEI